MVKIGCNWRLSSVEDDFERFLGSIQLNDSFMSIWILNQIKNELFECIPVQLIHNTGFDSSLIQGSTDHWLIKQIDKYRPTGSHMRSMDPRAYCWFHDIFVRWRFYSSIIFSLDNSCFDLFWNIVPCYFFLIVI